MQAAQQRPRAGAIFSAVALWLVVSLIIGAALAFVLGSLINFHNQTITLFLLPYWWVYFLIFSQWRKQHLQRLIWIFIPLSVVLYMLVVAGFIRYPPLALNLLGALLALLVVASFAQGLKTSSKLSWLLVLGCGLIGGAGAALVCWLMLGPSVINPPMMLLLVLAAGLAGPTGEALRQAIDALWLRLRRGRTLDTPEPAPSAASANLSRRDVLLGLGGLAGLVATGAGFTWLTRSLLAHAFPLVTYKSFGQVKGLSWSPDGKRIVSASGVDSGMAIWMAIWDATNGKEIISVDDAMAKGYLAIQAVAWSPDGTRIALGSQYDELFRFNNPNNPHLNAAIVDAATLRPLVTFSAGKPETSSDVGTIAWSPDSTRIATTSNQVQVWDAATGKQLLKIDASASVMAWSPDGRYLVTDNDNGGQVWDAESGALLTTYRGHTGFIEAVAWSPDSMKVASGGFDTTVQVWEARSGKHLLTYRGDDFNAAAVAWSPDGSHIASAGIAGDVHVWNAATGEQVFLYKGHTQQVNALAWAPEGSRIASGSDDYTVQIWQPT